MKEKVHMANKNGLLNSILNIKNHLVLLISNHSSQKLNECRLKIILNCLVANFRYTPSRGWWFILLFTVLYFPPRCTGCPLVCCKKLMNIIYLKL